MFIRVIIGVLQRLSVNSCQKEIHMDPTTQKRVFWAYADSECPDQTAHPRSLIRAFAVH